MSNKIKVKFLKPFGGAVEYQVNQVVEFEKKTADRLIASGGAELYFDNLEATNNDSKKKLTLLTNEISKVSKDNTALVDENSKLKADNEQFKKVVEAQKDDAEKVVSLAAENTALVAENNKLKAQIKKQGKK